MATLAELCRRGAQGFAPEASIPVADRAPLWRQRYDSHRIRVARDLEERDARLRAKAAEKLQALESMGEGADLERKRAAVRAALERARARRAT